MTEYTKNDIKFIMRRSDLTETGIMNVIDSMSFTRIQELKTALKPFTGITMTEFDKAMELFNAQNNSAAAFKWTINCMRNPLTAPAMTLNVDMPIIKTNQHMMAIEHDGTTISTNIREMTRVMESYGLNGMDVKQAIKECGWPSIMMLSEWDETFPYHEYKTNHPEIGMLIRESIRLNRFEWMMDFMKLIHDSHPVITQKLDMEWLHDNIMYPFEFYIESSQIMEPANLTDYNALVDERMTEFEKSIPSAAKYHAVECRHLLSPDRMIAGKTRNVNSRNIMKWMETVEHIHGVPDAGLIPTGYYSRDDDGIAGFRIFADITMSGTTSSSYYNMMIQTANATMEYIDSIYENDDSIIRWLIWLRAQRALRDNKTFIIMNDTMASDMYWKTPVFNHCPPEIIKWLHDGIIPDELTYDDIGSCGIPDDVKKRIMNHVNNQKTKK